MADKYSSEAFSYPDLTRKAILEMHRQVGVAKPVGDGLMRKGLMIRHLVMPNNVGGSKKVMSWIAKELPKDTYVNIMSQYRPMYKAYDYPELNRRITNLEFYSVVNYAKALGLNNRYNPSDPHYLRVSYQADLSAAHRFSSDWRLSTCIK